MEAPGVLGLLIGGKALPDLGKIQEPVSVWEGIWLYLEIGSRMEGEAVVGLLPDRSNPRPQIS